MGTGETDTEAEDGTGEDGAGDSIDDDSEDAGGADADAGASSDESAEDTDVRGVGAATPTRDPSQSSHIRPPDQAAEERHSGPARGRSAGYPRRRHHAGSR